MSNPSDMESSVCFLHNLLDTAAARFPQKVAVLTEETTHSYADLAKQSHHLAAWFLAHGVRRGDRIAIILPNSAFAVLALLAASRIGAIFCLVDPVLKPFGLRRLLADAAPVLIVTTSQNEYLSLFREYEDIFLVDLHWQEALALSIDISFPPSFVTDPVCFIYTSGSTSLPKAIISAHKQMLFVTQAIQACLLLREDDVIGCFLPLSFDYGLYQIFLTFLVGATLALGLPSDVGPLLLRKLRDWGVTGLPVVPTLAQALLQLGRRSSAQLPALRLITNTGAHLSAALIDGLQHLWPTCTIFVMYGLTECKRVAILQPSDYVHKSGSVGKALPGTECFILDEQGEKLPPGQVGELVVRGGHVMLGYWQAPELTQKRFRIWGPDKERVLFTGDMCSLDEDGYLYFHGRTDDLYKFHEYRISALEVEMAAYDIPGVEEAALVPPAVDTGPLLFVKSYRSQEEIFLELRLRLEDARLPEYLVVLPVLPHTINGKVDKEQLKRVWKEEIGS